MAFVNSADTDRSDRNFISAAMHAPYLEREEEFDLARRWIEKKDDVALHKLIESHARLVVRMAWNYRRSGLPLGDLVQEGNIGLAQAAARFDPDRDVRFATYAGWWIMAEIQDFILRNSSIIRFATTPTHRSLFFKLPRIRARAPLNPDGTLPSLKREELAKEMGVALTEVERVDTALARSDQSLNAGVGEAGEDEWQDFLVDERPSPEDIVVQMRDNETRSRWLADALKELTAREQTIIKERRLRDDVVTLEALGVELGISKERVRQIEHKALQKLRVSIEKQVESPADALADL